MRGSYVFLFFVLCLGACGGGDAPVSEPAAGAGVRISVTSPEFKDGRSIPQRYTCDGANVSPPLNWTGVPEGATSLALVADDPDAPGKTWVHWVVFNIPADAGKLPQNLPPQPTLANGARHGVSDFGKLGYGGPCPPSGAHRYFFKLYALDASLDLESGATKGQLLEAMKGHVLAQGQLIGTYRRR